jgi:hypothetical protein
MDQILGARGTFWVKPLFAGLLVILADRLLFNDGFGSAIGVFLGVWAALSLVAQRSSWFKPAALTAFAMAGLMAGAMTYDPSFLALLLFTAMLGAGVMLHQVSGAGDGWYWAKRLSFHAIFAPFMPIIDAIRIRKARRRSGTRLAVSRVLPTLVLPVLGTALFLSLFAMANPVIADYLDAIRIGEFTPLDVVRAFFWGCIFICVWSTLRPTRSQFNRLRDSEPSRIPGVNIISVTLSLALFNLVFALQNGMDLIYLWGDIHLPEQYTLAEYAHRGAYPLIATALLAGLFILITTHPKSDMAGSKLIRWLIIFWIAQNLFLVASTVERTLLYIDSYSLTRLRIAALLWMGLVGVGLVLVTWRMLRGQSLAWLVNGNLIAALLVLGACTFIDLGETAARWNVRHAKEVGGQGVQLDLCYLNQLNGSSLLPLASLEQRGDLEPGFKQRVTLVRQQVALRVANQQFQEGGWHWRNAHRLAALRRYPLKNLGVPKGYYVDCNGFLRPIGERQWEGDQHEAY